MWFLRPDCIAAFEDREIRDSLPRYIEVVEGRKPPLFKLSKLIRVDLRDDPWEAHEEGLRVLREALESDSIPKGDEGQVSLLDLKAYLSLEVARGCRFCEWRCGVNRLEGERGVCRVRETRVASHFIHMGEEPPVSPSGTIFFSGCNFKCLYCQNWDISQFPDSGEGISPQKLARIMDDLRRRGARNINLVGGEPTPNIHTIILSLRYASEDFPVIWNSNMYLSEVGMRLILGIVDLWLPDFKYWNDECARRLSGIPRYSEVVKRNLSLAYEFPPGEIIIRHLVLPAHVDCCTRPSLEWIAANVPRALVNVMDQYRPEYRASELPEINRRPSSSELREAFETAERLGLRWKSVSR
ncbi:MAG: radical SAM protein [Candidatus Korarchaeota archaeon NZ13-K]|nr:MAG: radical SAM protein [Candidatus Korarchaeota archaeon NZ13-K]